MSYLMKRDTGTKRRLLVKAIVALHPKSIFGKVLWKGQL